MFGVDHVIRIYIYSRFRRQRTHVASDRTSEYSTKVLSNHKHTHTVAVLWTCEHPTKFPSRYHDSTTVNCDFTPPPNIHSRGESKSYHLSVSPFCFGITLNRFHILAIKHTYTHRWLYTILCFLFLLSTKKILSSSCFHKFALYLWTRYPDFNFFLFNLSRLTFLTEFTEPN